MPKSKALAVYNPAQSQSSLTPHKVGYRVGNTKATAKGSALVQMLTGFNMNVGHVRLEDAQRATHADEYYGLQVKLMGHIKKKYGGVMKNVAKIEDIRAELQKIALDKDSEIAGMIAEMSKLNEKHGLDLQQLQHRTEGEIGVMRAQGAADTNVANADLKTRLMMITRGQANQVSQIQEGARAQLQQQKQRQVEAAQRSQQSAEFNKTMYEAMNNPVTMPATKARGIFQGLGRRLLGV